MLPGTLSINKRWLLLPCFGAALFALLYLIAACMYPGGSQADLQAAGFSWQHNYWCNLLNSQALNGQPNAGSAVAIAAMAVLCISLLCFWCLAAQLFFAGKWAKWIVCSAAGLCVAVLPFLSGTHHDLVINVSGFFGLVAMGGCYLGLYRQQWFALFGFGILNIVLIALNNYLYYTPGTLYHLPVVQKITFLSCLLWVCLVDVKLYKHSSLDNDRAV